MGILPLEVRCLATRATNPAAARQAIPINDAINGHRRYQKGMDAGPNASAPIHLKMGRDIEVAGLARYQEALLRPRREFDREARQQ